MATLDKHARSATMTFVGFMLMLVMLIAGFYFMQFTPGEPNRQSAPHAINHDAA